MSGFQSPDLFGGKVQGHEDGLEAVPVERVGKDTIGALGRSRRGGEAQMARHRINRNRAARYRGISRGSQGWSMFGAPRIATLFHQTSTVSERCSKRPVHKPSPVGISRELMLEPVSCIPMTTTRTASIPDQIIHSEGIAR